jgi:predicted nucleic acid-binding protein
MFDELMDTNVFSEVFKGNKPVEQYVLTLNAGVDSTVYIECLQGQKSNHEKHKIKKYLANFPILHFSQAVSKRAIELIDRYSNTHGLTLADAQIAAVCLEYDLTLITYNLRDFRFIVGLKIAAVPFPTI